MFYYMVGKRTLFRCAFHKKILKQESDPRLSTVPQASKEDSEPWQVPGNKGDLRLVVCGDVYFYYYDGNSVQAFDIRQDQVINEL